MHIVMVPSWYPQSEQDFEGSFFAEQARALVRDGRQVGVVAVRGTPAYQPFVRWRRPRAIRKSIEGGVAVFRKDITVPLPWVHAINQGVWNRAWARVLRQYISLHGRPDVLHAHAMFPAGLAAASLARRFRIPFVVTEHRPTSIDRLDEWGMRRQALKAAQGSSALIAVARGFAADLNAAYALDPESGWRYLPGLLSPQFEDIAPRPIPSAPFTVGHVSHLDPGKRVGLLIGAFADAFPTGTERLRIVGDSPHRLELERCAESEGIGDRVDFVGAVPRVTIAEEFSRFHVFVLPSEAEAFGTVLWEAMASGVPLVATATWAGKNAVSSDTGLVVPVDDRNALKLALQQLRATIAEYDPERIRSVAVEHCGQQSFVAKYTEIYQEARQK